MFVMKGVVQNRAKSSVTLCGIATCRLPVPAEKSREAGAAREEFQDGLDGVLKDASDFLWQKTVGMTFQLRQE